MKVSAFARRAAVYALIGGLAACGGGGSDGASSNPPPPSTTPPAITAQPASQSALTDASTTFSITATGPALTYQWQRNGTAIVGATSASYTTPPAAYTDHGAQYTVVVSNNGGTVTSAAATLNLIASTNQQIYENLALAPASGSHQLRWNLNLGGGQSSGTNFLFSDFAVQPQSPLTQGPQTTAQSAPTNMAATLALLTPGPTRILHNGQILVVPGTQGSSRLSYAGSDVKVETLAADNTTVAYTQIRSDYAFTALTGTLSASPDEFARWYNSIFANPAILAPGATYASGAGYVKYSARTQGDRYTAFDCNGATTGTNINPCMSATTLTAALTSGLVSNSDGTTYHLADGTVRTVGGVSVWVATAPRPFSASLSSTVQYRVYFELNNNVYTGSFIPDGTLVSGSYYVSNPSGATVAERLTYLPYHIRLNQAARDSIATAITF